MYKKVSKKIIFGFMVLFLVSLSSMAQDFSLDDDPTAPATCPIPVPGFFSAEDEFGIFGIMLGPSPSLWIGPFLDSDHLIPGPVFSFPLPPLCYVDAICANHILMTPATNPMIGLRFSVDRLTGGIPGSASNFQAATNQQSSDIFDSTLMCPHPANFAGVLPPPPPPPNPPYVGPLPCAGMGGTNILFLNEPFFGLITPPVPPAPGTHDNIDSYNDFPGPLPNIATLLFAIHPAEGVITGFSGADVFWAPAGLPGFFPPPYAPAGMLGLDMFNGNPNPNTDSIDGLIVWDNNIQGGVAEPAIDYALFSLASGSATLMNLQAMGIPVDGGTVFFTDFTGVFAVYVWSLDIGLLPAPPNPVGTINLDALEAF